MDNEKRIMVRMSRFWLGSIAVALSLQVSGSANCADDAFRDRALLVGADCIREAIGDSLFESAIEPVGGGWNNDLYRVDFRFRPAGADTFLFVHSYVSQAGECIEDSYLARGIAPLCADSPKWCTVRISRAHADSIAVSLGLAKFPAGVYDNRLRREVVLAVGETERRLVWKAVKSWPIGGGEYAGRVIELNAYNGDVLTDYADTLR